jgi:hypothetical protein
MDCLFLVALSRGNSSLQDILSEAQKGLGLVEKETEL